MAEEKEEKQGKKGGKSLVLIIVAVLLVVILIAGGLVIFLLASGGDEEQGADVATAQVAAQQQGGAKTPAQLAPKERSQDFFNVGPMYPLDQFLVNLLSETGSRYLKMSLNIELSAETLTPEVDQKKPLLRDIIIRVLTSKTYEDISTAKGKERLKDEIVAKINETLRDGYIKNVFFTDFIVQ